MPLITTAYHTQLAAAVTDAATVIRVAPNQLDLCDTVTLLGKNVVLTIFNAKHSELVLATGCELVDGIQHVTVQRGFGGTTAREWADGSCLCTANILDKCADTSSGAAECAKPLAGVRVDGCLEIVGGDTCTPTLRLKPTGVVPVNNDCIRINACGLVEWVSPTFPHDCLPVFEQCSPCASCGGTGGGTGATAAGGVSYIGASNTFAVGPTVQDALTQVDLALQAQAQDAAQHVRSVGAGAGISIGGTPTSPVLSLAIAFGSPGVYNGFNVNQYGQIVGYNQAQAAQHIGSLPISVAYNSASNTFTYSIAPATKLAHGTVRLLDAAEVGNAGVTSASDGFVVTWAGLLAFLDNYFPALNTANGVSGSSGIFNTARTIVLDILSLAANIVANQTDFAVLSTPSGANYRIGVGDLSRDMGGAYATAVVNALTDTIVAGKHITTCERQSAGVYLVTMGGTVTLPSIYMVNAVPVNRNQPYSFTYQPLSASQFEVRFLDEFGNPADMNQIAIQVTSAA